MFAQVWQGLSSLQKYAVSLVSIVFIYFVVQIGLATLFPPLPISVIGSGQATAKPLDVSFIVTKISRSTDPVAAINEGDIGMKILTDTATSVVGTDAEIKRSFYQVVPVAAGASSAYQVANAFSVKTTQVDKTSELVRSLYRDGATSISNLSFSPENRESVEAKARTEAVKNAYKQAQAIAKSVGKRVGKVISITDDNTPAGSTVGKNQQDSSSQSPFGEIEINKNVSVMYQLW